jgi:hypothetical protein
MVGVALAGIAASISKYVENKAVDIVATDETK